MKLKLFLAKIVAFITNLLKRVDKIVDQIAPVAIKVVNELKKINESSTGDVIETILVTIIPGKADEAVIDIIRAKLREILPKVILQLNIANSISTIEDPNEQIKAIIHTINISDDATKNAYYHVLCTMILESLSDGKLTWSESLHIAEFYYSNFYKKK